MAPTIEEFKQQLATLTTDKIIPSYTLQGFKNFMHLEIDKMRKISNPEEAVYSVKDVIDGLSGWLAIAYKIVPEVKPYRRTTVNGGSHI